MCGPRRGLVQLGKRDDILINDWFIDKYVNITQIL